MFRVIFFMVCFSGPFTFGQEIGRTAQLIDANAYFNNLTQELIYAIEDRQWCNFKAYDLTQTINDITHTNARFTGEATFTNGFLHSIQKISVTFTDASMSASTSNNVTVTTALVRGRVVFHDAKIGYDVAANMTGEDSLRHYTGYFRHSTIDYLFDLTRNMNTHVVSVNPTLMSLAGGTGVRMVLLPDDDISQIISLGFLAANNWNAARDWGSIMATMLVDIATNKLDFPDFCFNC